MKKFALMSVVVAGLYLFSGNLELSAQNKKGTTSKQGTIELIESRDGKYRFSIRDSDGKYLGGTTVGHATEKEAREAVETLKTVLRDAKYVSKKSEHVESDKIKNKDKSDK